NRVDAGNAEAPEPARAVGWRVVVPAEYREGGPERPVHAEARGVERRWIRVARRKSREAASRLRPVRHRKCVQERLDGVRGREPRRKRRHLGHRGAGLIKPQPFVRNEEERSIPFERAAEHAAKIVLAFLWLREALSFDEIVSGIEGVIPEVLEERAVELI